ncbi:MAG TPA: CbiX/SirB N-terminal domain-containing protein [Chloroflexota bacterium]|nr:CbiX/SirB N-terminal domain-containing protein [Chloroflexota bacterium]
MVLVRARDGLVTARKRFFEAAARLDAALPEMRVVAAYVSSSTRTGAGRDRTLGEAIEQLAAEGVREIAVVPYLVEWEHPDAYDVPDLLWDLAEAHPELTIRMASPLGLGADLDSVTTARLEMAWSLPPVGPGGAGVRRVAEIAGQTPVTTAALKEGELPRLPAHARHLFVCFGRRCMEEGSPEAHSLLTELLAERGLASGPNYVKVSRSKCLSPCQAAPVAVTYPDGMYYCQLTAETVPTFVDEVLVKGGTLPGKTFRPGE